MFNRAFSIILSVFVLASANVQAAESTPHTPDNLDKVFTFVSTRPFDSIDGTFFKDGMVAGDGMSFFKDVMGYSEEEIAANREAAKVFFMEKFGVDVNDPRIYFTGFQIDPAADYRVLLESGVGKGPGKGYEIVDGGWAAAVVDPAGLELGGEFAGEWVPAGTMFAHGGSYVIKQGPGKDDIVINYKSRLPMQPVSKGGVIVCEVEHPEYGTGAAWGYFEFHSLSNGQISAQVRNVLTFPAFGMEETAIEQ